MLKKQETINLLTKVVEVEERLIPIYATHLHSTIFWTGIKKDKAKNAKAMLQQLHDDSQRHRNMVEGMIKYAKEQGKDAF